MANKTYTLPMNDMMSTTYEITEDNRLVSKLPKKDIAISDITEVSIANAMMSSKAVIKIKYDKSGKTKSFGRLESSLDNVETKAFLEDLKSRLPQTAQWADERNQQASSTDEGGNKSYSLQCLPFGYAGAGLPRGLQIGLYWGLLSLAIFPLPILIYILATGGYKVSLQERGLQVKTILGKFFTWDSLENVDFKVINVHQRQYGTTTGKNRIFVFTAKGNGSKKFKMRETEARFFMVDMTEKGYFDKGEIEQYLV